MNKYDREGKRLYAEQAKAQDLSDTITLIRCHRELGLVTETWTLSTVRETYEYDKLEVVHAGRNHARRMRDELIPATCEG